MKESTRRSEMATRYETDWKAVDGWTVTLAAGPPELSLNSVFHFEGSGDGAWDSVMTVDGYHDAVGRECLYDANDDSLTLTIGRESYRLTRVDLSGRRQIRASLLGPGSTAGGSWVAEEGTSGVRDGKDDPPRTTIPRPTPVETGGRV
jgi:hypothetical protein